MLSVGKQHNDKMGPALMRSTQISCFLTEDLLGTPVNLLVNVANAISR